ncbi:hypothetical protein ACT6NV_00115 [Robiginitalea sp. IMCC44478]|uniref:hypothetical protein n=1 Tax=Robiginitalea sp. IMCC44478 TaxID=3459122 RepID=UPI00404171D4
MSNDPQDKKFKKWLDILQQESWQLELIISGFAIYGLFMVIEPIETAGLQADIDQNIYKEILFQGLEVSWYIITINLIAHVILRGLWIGAIGLRYVSADIDYDKLNYSPKFRRHLEKRVGSFDRYVASLEKYCSIIFAITFLLVFYLLGLLMITFCFAMLGLFLDKPETPDWVRNWIIIPSIIFIAIGTLLTFIDFATQGWLKRKKWTTFFYYPVYWVFKFLTLSILYRPMVYNFLDTRFGKRLSFFVVPIYLAGTLIVGTGFSTSNYLTQDMSSNSFTANQANYEDLMRDKAVFTNRASIPSRVIYKSALPVFVVYGKSIENDVFRFNEELKPSEDMRGIHSIFGDGTVPNRQRFEKLDDYLETLEDMYTLKVDSIPFKPTFLFVENAQKQIGFETTLDLQDFQRGKHVLNVTRKDFRADTVYTRTIIRIPFWYYPD